MPDEKIANQIKAASEHETVHKAIETFSEKGDTKSFAEFINYMLHGKLIEVYLSDAYESVATDQVSTDYPAVFCGVVEGAYHNCLVLNCAYIDEEKNSSSKVKFGHRLFINDFAIVTVNEVNGISSMEHMLIRSRDTMIALRQANAKK